MSDRIRVEVVYALPLSQDWVELEMDAGSTVRDAIERSGIIDRHPEIDLLSARVGIHGRGTDLDRRVRGGDRVEIYRALRADPKEVRRQRAIRRATKR